MDQSRRAVESYWRSRMVDGVTADDDKVAPVYKLEEICELLRASDASIVKEVADFVLKRLDNKSPLVKQKVGAPALPCITRGELHDMPESRSIERLLMGRLDGPCGCFLLHSV
jgi:hypothetical protein